MELRKKRKMEKVGDWRLFLNKEIKIILQDGENHFSKKQGLLVQATPTHLFIKHSGDLEAINLMKILRVEVLSDGSY